MAASLESISDAQQSVSGEPLADPEERRAIFAVLDSFRQYRKNSHYNTTHRRRQNLYALPNRQWTVLASPPFNILDTLNAVDDAIDHNGDLADAILSLGLEMFGIREEPEKGHESDWYGSARPNDMAKVHSTIRQFFRDWSREGFKTEVAPLLEIIITDLSDNLPKPTPFNLPDLLLPGAGLGRLLFELSLRGYSVEGNEISYHQLIASNFILNATDRANQYRLFPFATTFTNHLSRANQLQEVGVPDIHPATLIQHRQQQADVGEAVMGEMNMTAGDFLTSYSNQDAEATFDAVVTVYFIDTAPNLMRYIKTVRHCLREGGIWINIGPLLWHFDDRRVGEEREGTVEGASISESQGQQIDTGIGEPGSFELTDEEVVLLVKHMGFEIVRYEHLPEEIGGYIQDPASMIQNRYRCSHWVARKISGAQADQPAAF